MCSTWRAKGAREPEATLGRKLEIRPARAVGLERAHELLRGAGLPVEDVSAEKFDEFLVATFGDTVAGLIGLELFGDTGLLRSLVVDPRLRSAGLGCVLVSAAELKARRQGIPELWLLTIDADAFFERLGYRAEPREKAPSAIRETDEFTRLCPGDAVLMKKTLS